MTRFIAHRTYPSYATMKKALAYFKEAPAGSMERKKRLVFYLHIVNRRSFCRLIGNDLYTNDIIDPFIYIESMSIRKIRSTFKEWSSKIIEYLLHGKRNFYEGGVYCNSCPWRGPCRKCDTRFYTSLYEAVKGGALSDFPRHRNFNLLLASIVLLFNLKKRYFYHGRGTIRTTPFTDILHVGEDDLDELYDLLERFRNYVF